MDWESFYNNFRTPDFIAGYEIQNRLGGGAFGDVYKARKQSIGKPYAIKFLKIEDDSQREAVERELSQVRHFAAIDHPNLVTIEDMGTVLEVPYLIMGYAGEDTLARRLKAGAMPREQALLYFVQACRGVLALHDRRLVHFDLKPSNIFLKGEVARVGDYGLSKLMTDGRMTLSFGRGTPQYMAPEMLRTRADHRADIYSLGVILYETLTGNLPFETDAPGGLVLREEDVPPDFPDEFPARLRPAVESCLRLSPDDRYEGVGELLMEIDQTARLGDSVKIDWVEPAPRPKSAVTAGTAPSDTLAADADPKTPSSANEELRQTAAELARASVEVARGVWEGLRGTGEKVKENAAEPSAKLKEELRRAKEGLGKASTELNRSLHEATESLTRGPRSNRKDRANQRAAKRELKRVEKEERRARKEWKRAGRSRDSEPVFMAVGAMGSRTGKGRPASAPAAGMASAGTVPVPPRVEGGIVGTLFSTLVLGLEVVVSLVGNLLRGSVRIFKSMTDRLVRRGGGTISRGLRLVAFLLIMGVLGAVAMLIGMLFLEATGVNL
jgi:serine/threonine protein kinase